MDCIYCGKQLSSQREIDGREVCQDCGIKNRMDDCCEEVWDLMREGWGSQSAAMHLQRKFNLSVEQVDEVAWRAEFYKEEGLYEER